VSEELTVSETLANRRSTRSFLDTPIEEEKLSTIMAAAQWSASATNTQPWRFILVRDKAEQERVRAGLAPGNAAWSAPVPALVVVCGRPEDSHYHMKEGKQFYLFELGLAVQSIVLQAHALGLVVHQMGNFTEDVVRQAMGIPEDYKVAVVIALGYRGPPELLPTPELRAREVEPRVRKDFNEVVLYDNWSSTGTPLSSPAPGASA
jgi:nitroreductase